MDSHWYKDKKLINRKMHTLHSLCVGFAFFGILFVMTKIYKTSLCPIKNIFGVSCFGCGMTRGFISILKCDFKEAFEYNILSIPLFVGIGIYTLLAVTDIIFNKDYIFYIETMVSKKMYVIICTIILIVGCIVNYCLSD